MGGTSENDRIRGGHGEPGSAVTASELDLWFVQEILPLEPVLMQFLRRNWRNESGLTDLCQDIYIRVYEAAKLERPEKPKSFLLTTARNLLADRVRRERIVPIEAVGDVDVLNAAIDEPGPERVVAARDELRVLQEALDQLPKRCREAVYLKQVEGLSRREIALRMGVGEETVKQHLSNGMYALADILNAKPADLRKKP
jgi:RNA polymerase sigma-70 factor (ECF subfamily)